MYKKSMGYLNRYRSRVRNLPRYSGTVGSFSGIRRGIQTLQRQGRSMQMYQKRNRVRSGMGITTQHDKKFIYAKKTMPRYKKRVWKKFVKKVHAISEKELGTRTIVFNTTNTTTSTTDGNQLVTSQCLYGQRSTSSTLSDLYNISTFENTGNPTSADDATIDDTTKFIFQSGVLDLTIRNKSTLRTSSVDNLDGTAKMELDIYEVIVRKSARDATGNFNSLVSLIQDGEQAQTIAGVTAAGGGALTLSQRGVTPFDLPMSLSRYGIKILKKTKYFIPNGDTITYQMRDPTRHVFQKRELSQSEGFNKPGVTRCLLMVSKLVPGLTLGSTDGTYKNVLSIGVTRKYMYKIEGLNETRDGYLAL